MTAEFRNPRYGVRLASGAADLVACQALRHQAFYGSAGCDSDAFDPHCDHVMIAGEAGLVATFRLMSVPTLAQTYAAQSYDLSRLSTYPYPMLELGRFCIAAGAVDADVLRLAWGAVAQRVDKDGIGLIFGCSSFAGTDPAPYSDALGLLAQSYRAPKDYRPGRKAPETVQLPSGTVRRRAAVAQLPPLLRSYLRMGGWVSDHAVVDHDLNTLHVFTGLEVDRIPPARAAALRAAAQAVKGTCTQPVPDVADGHGTHTPSSAF